MQGDDDLGGEVTAQFRREDEKLHKEDCIRSILVELLATVEAIHHDLHALNVLVFESHLQLALYNHQITPRQGDVWVDAVRAKRYEATVEADLWSGSCDRISPKVPPISPPNGPARFRLAQRHKFGNVLRH